MRVHGEHAEAALQFCKLFRKAHNISEVQFNNAIIQRVAFCLRNFVTADSEGNPVVTMNLGEVTLLNKENERATRPKPKPFDSAF